MSCDHKYRRVFLYIQMSVSVCVYSVVLQLTNVLVRDTLSVGAFYWFFLSAVMREARPVGGDVITSWWCRRLTRFWLQTGPSK